MSSPNLGRGAIVLAVLLMLLPFTLVAQESEGIEAEVKGVVSRLDKADETTLWDLSARLVSFGPRAAPILKNELPGLSPRARLAVAAALMDPKLGEVSAGTEALVGLAARGNPPEVRVAAVEVLGEQANDTVEDALASVLDDTFDPMVRIALAKALWKITMDLNYKAALKGILKSDEEDVRIAGAMALAEIGDIDAARAILTRIQNEPTARGRLAKAYLNRAFWQNLAMSGRGAVRPQPAKGTKNGWDLEMLTQIREYIRRFYNDSPDVSDDELIEAAARGVMNALDPHSMYFGMKERAEWQEDLNPIYGGIGSYVNFVDERFTITRPIFGGPAYRAELKPGDHIVRVDGWDTTGKTTDEIVRRLRGKPGTKVIVTIYRKGWQKVRDFELVRARIHVPTVAGEYLPGDIGYVRLSTFARDTDEELSKELRKMEKKGMRALILDLRYNTGGYLETAEKICDFFLPEGKLIDYWQGRNERVAPYKPRYSTTSVTHPNYPMVILVNGASASASEIVSGCLQYHGRAAVVGLRTFGKGSVQNIYNIFTSPPAEPWTDKNGDGRWEPGEPFEDKNGNGRFDFPAVKITIGKYYLPSGVSLQREKKKTNGKIIWTGGVEPDVWIAPAEPDGWRNEELAKLMEKKVFDNYLDEHYEANAKTFEKLAYFDGGTWKDYPDFEKFYESLGTKLDRHDVWWWLRSKVRRRVADMNAREAVADFVLDQQLQVGILTVLERLGLDPKSIEDYRLFADKDFPEVPEELKAPPTASDPNSR